MEDYRELSGAVALDIKYINVCNRCGYSVVVAGPWSQCVDGNGQQVLCPQCKIGALEGRSIRPETDGAAEAGSGRHTIKSMLMNKLEQVLPILTAKSSPAAGDAAGGDELLHQPESEDDIMPVDQVIEDLAEELAIPLKKSAKQPVSPAASAKPAAEGTKAEASAGEPLPGSELIDDIVNDMDEVVFQLYYRTRSRWHQRAAQQGRQVDENVFADLFAVLPKGHASWFISAAVELARKESDMRLPYAVRMLSGLCQRAGSDRKIMPEGLEEHIGILGDRVERMAFKDDIVARWNIVARFYAEVASPDKAGAPEDKKPSIHTAAAVDTESVGASAGMAGEGAAKLFEAEKPPVPASAHDRPEPSPAVVASDEAESLETVDLDDDIFADIEDLDELETVDMDTFLAETMVEKIDAKISGGYRVLLDGVRTAATVLTGMVGGRIESVRQALRQAYTTRKKQLSAARAARKEAAAEARRAEAVRPAAPPEPAPAAEPVVKAPVDVSRPDPFRIPKFRKRRIRKLRGYRWGDTHSARRKKGFWQRHVLDQLKRWYLAAFGVIIFAAVYLLASRSMNVELNGYGILLTIVLAAVWVAAIFLRDQFSKTARHFRRSMAVRR